MCVADAVAMARGNPSTWGEIPRIKFVAEDTSPTTFVSDLESSSPTRLKFGTVEIVDEYDECYVRSLIIQTTGLDKRK